MSVVAFAARSADGQTFRVYEAQWQGSKPSVIYMLTSRLPFSMVLNLAKQTEDNLSPRISSQQSATCRHQLVFPVFRNQARRE
jgi:hypothetical protein